ncbi:uncharacterized protein LOC113863794 [Abrus precatorius]|uniref:Uncharacterized protein LOC113863794 n=1 Tax=Abrus precatorius TaxID=3816 RepID=A0A8B8LAP7_ABRPR|nr:uncharacterized protein LOC113863794 [Abrus precatorius]
MGNSTSCSCVSSVSIENSLKKSGKGTKTAILLDTSGNIREIKLPAKSAELMIEQMGHVITPVDELRRTGRVSALRADEELGAGKVYLLLPVTRVHYKATEFEMAIAEKQSGHRKSVSGNNVAKVSQSLVRERDGENEVVVFPACTPRPRNKARWNPVLDTISESSSCVKEFTPQL